jgi:hypothetical protein
MSNNQNLTNNTVAVVFTGISHDNGKFLSGWGKKFKRSFLSTYENHFEKIIDPLRINNSVDIFLTTYNNELKEELIEKYKPISSVFINGYKHTMRSTYMRSLLHLIDFDKTYDFYICTRFDIKYYNDLSSWNINQNKFNLLFKENWSSDDSVEVCDVFFAFPKDYLVHFLNAIYQADKKPKREFCSGELHYIYDYLVAEIGVNNIHFISTENQSTANAVGPNQTSNSYFYLCREES